MSEYQYYEFAAIDSPLTKAQMSKLRAISSRAHITPRRFTNTYEWGDFKGRPEKLMEQFFDAHLYTSNFGIRHLYLRVPLTALPLASVKDYLADECLNAWKAAGNLILHFSLSNDEGGWDDDYDWDNEANDYYDESDDDCYEDYGQFDEDGIKNFIGANARSGHAPSNSLDALLPLRDELARGDLRSLYLGWLGGVQRWQWGTGEYTSEKARQKDLVTEPPVPPGLDTLTPAQQTLALFLKIDADLITAAAEKCKPTDSRRTADTLLRCAEELAAIRKKRKAEEAARAEAERQRKAAEARELHLDRQAAREPELWPAVRAHIATRLPKEYDQAVSLLLDLRDLARRRGKDAQAAFVQQLFELKEQHAGKRTLIARIDKAFAKSS